MQVKLASASFDMVMYYVHCNAIPLCSIWYLAVYLGDSVYIAPFGRFNPILSFVPPHKPFKSSPFQYI